MARTGRQYVEDLRNAPREVYLEGERVKDVTRHPRLRGVVESVARLYDMQGDPALEDEMTYWSEADGCRVGMSFLEPKSRDDLRRRRRMMKRWADASFGMMGRTPDYLNSSLMAFGAAASYFGQAGAEYAQRIRDYAARARRDDLCLTHTLITPQVNRGAGPAGQPDPYVAAGVVQDTDAGLVIRGGRMLATLGPVADDLMVFPSTVLRGQPGAERYAFAFSIPCGTPGLRFICREGFDLGRPAFDHPLGSRFEEMDAVVAFDDVVVPWERVFIYGNLDLCNDVYGETHAVLHMAHQVAVKNLAKAEFVLGLTSLMADAIGITGFQHVQEKIAEVILAAELMRACVTAAEAEAAPDAYGVMCPARPPLDVARNLFPRLYPRLVEIIQLLGASGLMALPTRADLDGPVGPDIARYLQARNAPAADRLRLFRLAWDASLSSFGARQVLYERFFFGDPVRMMSALYEGYDASASVERVRAFLEQDEARPGDGGA